MTNGILISSNGYQSGKSTLADYLIEYHRFYKISFAEPIKKMCESIISSLGYNTKEWIYGDKKETVIPDLYVSPRQLMQTLGLEWGRELINYDIWVIIANKKIEEATKKGFQNFVIDDWRFPNETNIKIDNLITVQLSGKGVNDTHGTENQILKPMYSYHNNLSQEKLYEFGDLIVKMLFDYKE